MELDRLDILYRGDLSSCNYDCGYCPFAKVRETHAELEQDRKDLDRFVKWCKVQDHRKLGIFFTPWGEALIRRWYCEAVTELSHMPHVERVAVQTNLSFPMGWLDASCKNTVALWATYHPDEVTLEKFCDAAASARAAGIRHSVGSVGLREHVDRISELRDRLPASTYVWINAYKRDAYYDATLIERFRRIDPLFPVNLLRFRSRGRRCRTGASVVSVNGEGTLRRCHFVKEPIGSIYDDSWEACLTERACPAEQCGCHIGYVHMPELRLYDMFVDRTLERMADPATWAEPTERAKVDAFVDSLLEQEAGGSDRAVYGGFSQVSIRGR